LNNEGNRPVPASICDANAPVAAIGDEPQVLGLGEQVVELSQDFNESWGPFDVVEDKYHNDAVEDPPALSKTAAPEIPCQGAGLLGAREPT
jgi:hypothetical protein